MFNITGICVRVHFNFNSYLLCLVSSSCFISQCLMQQWKHSYIFLISFLLFSQEYYTYPSQSLDIYSSKYKYISLYFTNWLSSSFFLKSLPKLQSKSSLRSCQAQFTLGQKSTRWTQSCIDLWNDLGFSLCAVLPVCHVVATSDNRKKSKMGVSADLVCHH